VSLSEPLTDASRAEVGGALTASRRVLPIVLFAALPAVVAVAMFLIALRSGPLALDFHHELYPEAKEILAGRNPIPVPTSLAGNYLWPPLAALLVSPLTVLPPTAADVAIGLLGLVCVGLALWLVGVRDWRVYGAAALWPQVIGEIRISHLTPVLCLLAAVVWRYRDATLRPGLALGVAGAVKFLLWPLGVWLLALRRTGAALIAAAVAAGSLLLVLPYTGLDEFAKLMVDLGRAFDQDGYSPFGLLVRLGVSDTVARGVTLAIGAYFLVRSWQRRNFALAVAASLVLAPIVWLDYYALTAVPLAVARPRLSAIWLLPLASWGLPSSGIATDEVWGVGRVLLVFGVVLWVAARHEPLGVSLVGDEHPGS
jgi:alpha-1,2-mannosyltransferase